MGRWIVMAAALLAAFPLLGQETSCDDAFREAQRSYDLGFFENVSVQLAPCLTGRVARSIEIQARSLRARAFLNADEVEKARREVATILRLDATFDAGTSFPRFTELIARVRSEEQATKVASVSKTNENLREAPATVVVVTGEEIRRRGYLDLEDVLHDLPGFDFARTNGVLYSNIFQRGYSGETNDRLLLLIDGIMQNELTTSTVALSRQYSLTNIDRVEVIYGPASTMYGANAYTGVISLITKEPEAVAGEGKGFGYTGQVTAGGYDSRVVDVTLAGRDRTGTLAWSVAANYQQANERDLSGLDQWDLTYRNFDYKTASRLTPNPGNPFADSLAFFAAGHCAQPSPWFTCDAQTKTVELTPAGENLMRSLDREFAEQNGLGFDDHSVNWSINGKVRLSNLTFGLQAWRSQEGIGSAYRAITISGRTSFTPQGTALYLKYSLPLDRVRLNVFTRYEEGSIRREKSVSEVLHNYSSGFLGMWSLVGDCTAPRDIQPVGCPPAPAAPWMQSTQYGDHSNQIRTEFSAAYDSSETLDAVAGLEFARSSLQSTLSEDSFGAGYIPDPTVTVDHLEHTDLALYAQGSYKPSRALKFVFAGRLSHNQINNKPGAAGYGTLFTPRVGVIYSPGAGQLILKAIYSEAFKDPTDVQKFGTSRYTNEYPSGGLVPETARNLELSAGWEPSKALSVEGAVYQTRYSDVVAFGFVPTCTQFLGCLQYQNRDDLRIRGLQLTSRYRRGDTELWGNYTHTEPFQVDPEDLFGNPVLDAAGRRVEEQRIADIAADRWNLGVDRQWSSRWNTALRLHYVGPRRTGPGTNQPGSPFRQMDPYTTADATISYRGLLPNTTFQLIALNLFDAQYYDPGLQRLLSAPRVLQAGRTIHLRIAHRWP